MVLRLQFGHGGDAVGDSVLRVELKNSPAWLQFGHGGDAVGDSGLYQAVKADTGASIRPRR